MARFSWLFWILVAAVVAVPACLMLTGDAHGNARLSLGDIPGLGIATLVCSPPAVIGIVAGVKSFRRESKERPCSVRMRLVSASWALGSAVPLGMLAGALLGFTIDSWPSSGMFDIRGEGFFGAVIGLCYGLFVSSASALLFGTGVGQRPSAQDEL